jgi:predicted RND superfamily exporter protein
MSFARPRAVLAVCFVASTILGVVGLTADRDLTFTGVMERSDPLVARYLEATARTGAGRRLPLILEGPEAGLDALATTLGPHLAQHPLVDVAIPLTADALPEDLAPYLVERAVFDDWLALATRPEDAEAPQRLARALEELAAELKPPTGLRQVLVLLNKEPLDVEAGGKAYFELEAHLAAALPDDVTGRFTGVLAVSAQDQARTFGKVQLLTPISLLLVLVWLRLFERSFRHVFAVGLVMLLTSASTLGILGLVTERLTIMESFFGVMVFGLGVDFALHLIARRREARARGHSLADASARAARQSGPGILAGGLTTAGAFLIVSAAPEAAALHLGLSGGIGLLVCLVLMFTALPALWALLGDKTASLEATPPPAFMRFDWVRTLAGWATTKPWLTVVLFVIAAAFSAVGIPRFHWETDLEKVFNREVPAIDAARDLAARFGVQAAPWIVLPGSLEEAARVAQAARRRPRVLRVDSPSDLLRPDRAQRAQQLAAAVEDIRAQRAVYDTLRELSTPEEAERLTGVIRLLDALDGARTRGPPAVKDLPDFARRTMFTTDGAPLVNIYTREETIDGIVAREQRAMLESIHESVVGFPMLVEATVAPQRTYLPWISGAILVFVLTLLMVDLRDPRLVLAALSPVAFGFTATLGILCWAGVAFNVITVMVVPLVIGLGVDDGIHVTHRLREGDRSPADAAHAVGRAVVMTTLTTCTSFAAFLFSDHAGLESFAWVILVGLPLCLLSSITLLPALAVALGVVRRS